MEQRLSLIFLLFFPFISHAGFLTQDAAEGDTDNPPSLHKYLYANQNPVVFIDPDGNAAVIEADQVQRLIEAQQRGHGLIDPGAGLQVLAGQEGFPLENVKVPSGANSFRVQKRIDPSGVSRLAERIQAAQRERRLATGTFVVAEAHDTPGTVLQTAQDFLGNTGSVTTQLSLQSMIGQKRFGAGDTVVDITNQFNDAVAGARQQEVEKGLVGFNRLSQFATQQRQGLGTLGRVITAPAQIAADSLAALESVPTNLGLVPGTEAVPTPILKEALATGIEVTAGVALGFGSVRLIKTKVALPKGRLRIDPNGNFSQSEIDAAYHMAARSKNVELRSPVGTRGLKAELLTYWLTEFASMYLHQQQATQTA